ncbi:hypothetical protein C8R45DRAFT_1010406 [Mycena sanguinolenta]|nr:hypothetical protein C8R45DRAFT_1010406 [Mycena sanguinolenta]
MVSLIASVRVLVLGPLAIDADSPCWGRTLEAWSGVPTSRSPSCGRDDGVPAVFDVLSRVTPPSSVCAASVSSDRHYRHLELRAPPLGRPPRAAPCSGLESTMDAAC